MNLDAGFIFGVLTEEVADKKHITMDDYLLAIGAKHFKRAYTLLKEKEYDVFCQMAEYMFEHIDEWNALYKYLSDGFANSSAVDFEVTTSLSLRKFMIRRKNWKYLLRMDSQ